MSVVDSLNPLITGVASVGLVANTSAPVPVSPVTAAARLALLGVPRNVATPVPRLLRPVPPLATGSVPVTVEMLIVDHVGAAEAPPEVKT